MKCGFNDIRSRYYLERINFRRIVCRIKHYLFFFFFNCMFYQLLRVQHNCSSTQSLGSVLPSIVETRDQNSRGCPFSFRIYIAGIFLSIGARNPIHPQPLGSCGPLQE